MNETLTWIREMIWLTGQIVLILLWVTLVFICPMLLVMKFLCQC